ncbi:SDR family NAD(P)-dependent oxidoreductase [Streptomyces olivaceus]|uniref:SDR family NAD(P)-dependent oxidoreductase n=1 Tax=Streptomyces olivaceus TaxID=47716 RepID=UPI00405642A5
MNNTTKRTALVTGANKGIGLETARQLADAGYVVWIGSRNLDRGRAAAEALSAHGEVRVVALDVTDEDSVRSAAAEIGAAHGSLDVLVNNAAVAMVEGEGPPSAVDLETVREDIEVNLFGPLRVTQAFLPLVKKSPEGRIVNVSTKMASLSPLADPESIQRAAQKAFPIFAYPGFQDRPEQPHRLARRRTRGHPDQGQLGLPGRQQDRHELRPLRQSSLRGSQGRRARRHAWRRRAHRQLLRHRRSRALVNSGILRARARYARCLPLMAGAT